MLKVKIQSALRGDTQLRKRKKLNELLGTKGTTAGWKGTFAYDKLIQFLVWMATEPDKAFIMGGTWRIPVLVKLLDKNFIQDLKKDGTFNEASFDREYKLFVFFKYRELLENLYSQICYNIKIIKNLSVNAKKYLNQVISSQAQKWEGSTTKCLTVR